MDMRADFSMGEYLYALARLSKKKALHARGSLLDLAEDISRSTDMQAILLKSGPRIVPEFAGNDVLATMILLRTMNRYAAKTSLTASCHAEALLNVLPATAAASEYVGRQLIACIDRLASKYESCRNLVCERGAEVAIQLANTSPAPSTLAAADLAQSLLKIESGFGGRLDADCVDRLATLPARLVTVDAASARCVADGLITRANGEGAGFACQQFMVSSAGGRRNEPTYIFWSALPDKGHLTPAIASVGCFTGTLADLKSAVDQTHADAASPSRAHYQAVLADACYANTHRQHLPRYSSLHSV